MIQTVTNAEALRRCHHFPSAGCRRDLIVKRGLSWHWCMDTSISLADAIEHHIKDLHDEDVAKVELVPE